jgi:hypothetical protein|tara:strand:+ start:795 stop:980 length:186 start_codon:yes stop_codon:yes gene_type:complete
MKALILGNKVVQTQEESFPVASELVWIEDIPEGVEAGYLYEDEEFSKPDGWDARNDPNNTP